MLIPQRNLQCWCVPLFSLAPDAFIEIVELTNYSRLWDAKGSWYSACATHQIYPKAWSIV